MAANKPGIMYPSSVIVVFILSLSFPAIHSLDNGLARTPPMGWMSWVRFACETNCDLYPKGCINQELYMEMADMLADSGYKDAGYQYVNIDDCWSEMKRDPTTSKLVADQKRFPNGIPALADYIHAKGLKFGIYSDIGTKTCAGYPGHLKDELISGKPKDYFSLDAQTFAEWNVDSLKVDGCYANTTDFDWMYPSLGKALNHTQRPILYSCSWPAYVVGEGRRPDYESIAKHCNLWRNYDDIMDSWPSVLSIIDFYAKNQDDFERLHGPGQWFDPDMVIVGDFGLSVDEARAQFGLWSMMSAPLLMSNDLRSIPPEFKEILLNRHVISVDQDPLGHLGRRVFVSTNKAIEVWAKRLTGGSFAILYFNRGVIGNPKWVSYKVEDILNKILLRSSEHHHDDNGVDGKRGGIVFSEREDESEDQQVVLPEQVTREQEVGFEDDDDLGSEGLSSNLNLHDNNNENKESISSSHNNGVLRHAKFSVGKGKVRPFNESDYEEALKKDRLLKENGIENHTRLADLYYVVDLFAGGDLIAKLTPGDNLVLQVNLSGVRMVKLIPRKTTSTQQHLPPLFRANAFQ